MYRFLLFVLLFLSFSSNLQAAQSTIPKELQAWIPWVLYEQDEKTCTINARNTSQHFCTWPANLIIDVKRNGAKFTQKYTVETKSLVPLPGSAPFWPQNVQANGEQVLVINTAKRPAVWLDPGEYTISGEFNWKALPEYLLIPPATGLVSLHLYGKAIEDIQLDQKGRLWFKRKTQIAKTDEESLSLQVFRKIDDGIPLLQHLQILLTVSGAPRQISLGLQNDPTFVPLSLQSPLPIRFDEHNRLQLQVRPGQWNIRLTLRNSRTKSPEALGFTRTNGPWPEQEIWVFAADQKLRQVIIKGVPAVDPSRTALPENWKNLPAYLVQADKKMQFIEKNRGNPSPVPNRLSINRQFWLDEQGTGLTVLDNISGTMTSKWRLEVVPSQNLGKVDVAGSPRLITKLTPSGKTGIEIRKGKLSLAAESRIETAVQNGKLSIPAVGWDHTVQNLSGLLNLPPGWKLISATGVDIVSTWLNNWSLLDIFLVLIIALATGRILGWAWGLAAFVTLTLCFHQNGSPTYIWLPLLATLGLQKIVQSANAERITRFIGLIILTAIIISSIPFMVQEIRVGIYPQLEYGRYKRISQGELVQRKMAADLEDEVMLMESAPVSRTLVKKKRNSYQSTGSYSVPLAPKRIEIDPQEMIQTGPGLPNWAWTRVPLRWNGPVNPEQNISFLLLSPFMGTILAFVRVALLCLLLVGFLRKCVTCRTKKTKTKAGTAVAAVLFCAITLSPPTVQAEIPSPELLQELQSRLLAPPECGTECASINTSAITIENELLTLTLQVDAIVQAGVVLPGKNRFFDSIFLDKTKATALLLNKKGFTNIRVEPGSHIITLKKTLNGLNKVTLYFPMLPVKSEASLQGWTIHGMRDDGRLSQQISLTRLKSDNKTNIEAKKQRTTVDIPAFVQVERTLHVNLKWTVSTRIVRKSRNSVVALDIPLLPGEHVTSDNFHIADKHVRINMLPGQQSLVYHSSIEPVDSLLFTASKTSSWNEVWFLDISPIWHVETKGIPEINQTNPSGKRYPEFHPYPGETLELLIVKPVGVPGPTMTINKSKLQIKPGRRSSETSLTFSLTASRGMQHSITLPPGIEIQKTLINQQEIPLQLENNKLTLPLSPGNQQVEIGWRAGRDIGYKTVTEAVNLGADSVNHSIEMRVPSSRWILFTGGPRVGPAVLFWGELLVIILIALFLGRIPLTPLSTLQWLLLSLGLSQIPAAMAAIVVVWLLLLGLRKQRGMEIKRIIPFNLFQVLLGILTLFALGTLFFAIQQGLLGHPDMQIGGNGSSGHLLHWYQDRSEAQLPTAWVISVPLLAYRIAMLLWALWLAMALLRWLRWGWDCFSDGSIWRAAPPRKKTIRKTKAKTKRTVAPSQSVTKKQVQKATPQKPDKKS